MEAYRVFLALLEDLQRDQALLGFAVQCIAVLEQRSQEGYGHPVSDEELYDMFSHDIESRTKRDAVPVATLRQCRMWVTAERVVSLWFVGEAWQRRLQELVSCGGLDFYTQQVLPRVNL